MSTDALLLGSADDAMILARAAQLREQAIKDKTYQLTPIGRIVGRYLAQLAFDNYSRKTIDVREQILCHLSLDLADKHIADVTLEQLRGFLAERFGQLASNTRASATSTVRTFFQWAEDEELVDRNPARRLKVPKVQDSRRVAHDRSTIIRLVAGQEQRRDKLALMLMYWCALRKTELRLIQWEHINLARRVLVVRGKGGKVIEQAIPEEVALELERYIQDEDPQPDHFLLYPQKIGRRGHWPDYETVVVWHGRSRPLTDSGIDRWWKRCVQRAGLPHFPMHEIRHSAGTHYHEQNRDLVATQKFMRHASASTTERVYLHLDTVRYVAEGLRKMPWLFGADDEM